MKRICKINNVHPKFKSFFLKIQVIFVLMLVCLLNSLQVQAATTKEVKERWYDTHYYPLYPGNEEWQKHDMVATLDILNPPQDLLLSISTEELAALMQEHPLMSQITTYYGEDGNQDYATFYAFMETNSDIFYELLRREDGFSCILEAYRKHEIDVELLNTDDYVSEEEADKAYTMWWQEIYGCQFIRYYASHFTESEYQKACEIIEEKKELYAGLNDTNRYYLDLPDIEPGTSEEVATVRTNYLSEAQIQEKEEKLAVGRPQTEELEKKMEQDSDAEEKEETWEEQPENAVEKESGEGAAEISLWIVSGIVIVCLLGAGLILVRRKKKR